jgi:cephalosporin-C deacetylase-like acetyl esterase
MFRRMQNAGGLTDEPFSALRTPQPLSLQVREYPTPARFGDAGCRRIEFTSRGDRVPARLLLPTRGASPHPLILLQHGAGGSKDAEYLEVAAPWVAAGAAVVTIDLPLHGERYNPKFSERLLENVEAGLSLTDPAARAVPATKFATEYARQAVSDLMCCLDAATTLPEIDAERIVYAAFSFGGILGTLFCALDPRPRAVALAVTGGGFGPTALDPASYVARIAPRPVLILGARNDEIVRPPLTEALFEAAGEPKSLQWFDGGHQTLPGVAMKAMWVFMREHLALS